MTGSNILLDTNAVIAISRDDARILDYLEGFERISISLFTLGELIYGVEKSMNSANNRRRLNLLLKDFQLLLPRKTTADCYGDICNRLRKLGKPIPANDAWIAATAMEQELPLLTRDSHFHQIEGLQVESW